MPFSEAATGAVLYKKGVLESFAKFTGKYVYWVFFSIKLQASIPLKISENQRLV